MKQVFLLIAMIGMTTGLMAQSSFSIGLRGGVNLATVKSGDQENDNFLTGVNIAVPMEIGLSPYFSIQPELQFIQKGIGFDFNDATPSIDLKVRAVTNYFEVPLLFKSKIKNDFIAGYATLGPSFGFALNRKNVQILNGDRDSEKVDFDDDGAITDNRLDLGVVFGIGTEITVGNGAIVFDARYNLDVNDNVKFEGDKPNDWDKTSNRGLAFTVGYVMRFGEEY